MGLTRALTQPATRTPAPPGVWQASCLDSDTGRGEKARVVGGRRGEVSDRRWSQAPLQRWRLPRARATSACTQSQAATCGRGGAWPPAPPRLGDPHPGQGAPSAPSPRRLPPRSWMLRYLRAAWSLRPPQTTGGRRTQQFTSSRFWRLEAQDAAAVGAGAGAARAFSPACRRRLAVSSRPVRAGRALASFLVRSQPTPVTSFHLS